MVAGVESRLLPPWLDTEMAVAPIVDGPGARRTGRVVMPLIMNGPPHCSRSQARSFQVGGAEPIHCP